MQFNSYSYLLCLFFAVSVFWALPVRFRRSYVLTLSLAFYASWNIWYVCLPLFICGIAYLSARRIRQKPADARFALWCGIAAVLFVLAFFKYRGLMIETAATLFSQPARPSGFLSRIVLPLGISFYSFEAISYLLDTRQGRVSRLNFMDLALFVTFWPHLIAGPIVRVRELVPQLNFKRAFESSFLLKGLDRLIWGLVQKNLIANNLGGWIDDGFQTRAALLNSTLDNWFLAVAFGLQIYFDFAAYSNMAIGAAQLIGIQLPENFRFPYHAWNPSDFWSRWHLTLSRWIRDYIFFPLNAKHKGAPIPLYASTLGVMALVGLWHGAGWGYVLWGLMQGGLLVAYRIFESLQGGGGQSTSKPSPHVVWMWRLITLAMLAAAWVPFRAPTLTQSGQMLGTMFLHWKPGLSYSANFYVVTLLTCLFCALEPGLGDLVRAWHSAAEKQKAFLLVNVHLARPLIYAFGILLFVIFDDQDTQFIYFQF